MAECLPITFTEKKRNHVGRGLLVFNLFSATVVALTFAFFVISLKLRLQERQDVLADYSPETFLHFMIATGAVLILYHMIAAKVQYDMGTNPSTREKWILLTMAFTVSHACIIILLIVAIGFTNANKVMIQGALPKGIEKAMAIYKDSIRVKTLIDHIQVDNSCCGYRDHRDWFEVQWIPDVVLNVEELEKQGYV